MLMELKALADDAAEKRKEVEELLDETDSLLKTTIAYLPTN
jgi:hypothetical protein